MKNGRKYIAAAVCAGIVCIAAMLGVLSAAIYAEDENGGRLLGIMYHQVLKDEDLSGKYIITPDMLESDFKYLSDNGYTSVLPSELIKIKSSKGSLPEKTVMLTFDDGYETGLYYVLPLLEKYGMKAVINIVGSYTDEYSELGEEGKHLSYAYLTWDEIKKLSDSGYVEIGNHTYNMHTFGGDGGRSGCAQKDEETQEAYSRTLYADISALSDKLESVTEKRPAAFAYPFGALSEGSADIISKAGIEVFMTCCELPSNITADGRTVINRYNRDCKRSAEDICREFEAAL